MKKSTKKLTLLVIAGSFLLASMALPSAFAAELPAGTVISGGLTWTRNNNTFARGTYWSTGKNSCDNLTTGGYADWRLPTKAELLALYAASKDTLTSAGWTLGSTWSSTNTVSAYHWVVTLDQGKSYNTDDTRSVLVSCVR